MGNQYRCIIGNLAKGMQCVNYVGNYTILIKTMVVGSGILLRGENMKCIELIKGEHRYLFSFDLENELQLYRAVADYAKDGNFNIDWSDIFLFVEKFKDIQEGSR